MISNKDVFELRPDLVREVDLTVHHDLTIPIAVTTRGGLAAAQLSYTAANRGWALTTPTPSDWELVISKKSVTLRCLLQDSHTTLDETETEYVIRNPATSETGNGQGVEPLTENNQRPDIPPQRLGHEVVAVGASTLLNTTVTGPWHKHYQLGMGIDAVTGQARASAVKPFTVNRNVAEKQDYNYTFVENKSELTSLISASAKGEYNIEGVTVSGSASFLNEIAVSELAVTLVASLTTEQIQFAMAPNSTYQLAVTPDKTFRDKYGDYFVAGHRGGSSLFVMYQCRFSNSKDRVEFSASLAAKTPNVFTVEGAASFQQTTTKYSANVRVKASAFGVTTAMPKPPEGGWTSANILSVLIPWYNDSRYMVEYEAILWHYRLIDPSLSGEVAISPDIFARLLLLYKQFRVASSLFSTCPEFGRRIVKDRYDKLEIDIQSHQASLPNDEPQISLLTKDTNLLLQLIDEVNNRQLLYSLVLLAARSEPGAGESHDADKGTVRWSYGFDKSNLSGVSISSKTENAEADWRVGWNEKTLTYRDTSKIIVGWDVICNWSDHGGDWHKVSQQVLGRNTGDVYVKSDYDRGYSWTVNWHLVDAALYPLGPWTDVGLNGSDFITGERCDLNTGPFWTPDLMDAAQPVQRPITDSPLMDDLAAPSQDWQTARATDICGSEPSGSVSDPLTSKVSDVADYPNCTVGKIFFMRSEQLHWASAVVVHRFGILTAAHCLWLGGQESTSIVFVPAYETGNTYGVWEIDRAHWTRQWQETEDPAWDVGLCTVRPIRDQGVGDVVGFVGLEWGGSAGSWNAFGYPTGIAGDFSFDQTGLWQCLSGSIGSRPSTVAKLDTLTGSSGGPWFIAGKPLVVNSVKSQGDSRQAIGPEFLDWVGTFFADVLG